MKRKITAMALVFAMVLGIFAGVTPVTASAEEIPALTVKYAKTMEELEAAVEIGYTETAEFPAIEGFTVDKSTKTVKVEVPYDSLLCFDMLLTEEGNGASWGYLKIYSNQVLSGQIYDSGMISCGRGTPESERASMFLKKGTYYAKMELHRNNYFDETTKIKADLCVTGIKKTDAFTVSAKEKPAGKYELSLTNNLGSMVKQVFYKKGSFAEKDKYDSALKELAVDAESVTVKTPGKYSVVICLEGTVSRDISEEHHNFAVYTVNVKSSDKTKPVVSGVKNGKTYHRAVTIKFSDKGSGIKSAKLNGKNIKSGKKVSRNGSYTLVVTDNAGNKTTVKFKIKK